VSVGQTKNGKPLIIQPVGEDTRALIKLYYYEGYRGSNSYDYDHEKIKVLMNGIHAQGAAGRMGSGIEMVLIMEPNTTVLCKRFGRTYGEPKEKVVSWDGESLKTFNPEDEPDDCDLVVVETI
jgi:hypothetical protein